MKFNEVLDNVKTYEAGKPIELVVRDFGIKSEDVIKLASNENPNGCSPKVTKAIQDYANNMYLYPDDSMYELKEKLANKFSVNSSNIVIGAGSDQVIEFAIHAKCNKDSKILIAGVTFAMYEIYAKTIGATVIKTESIEHNLDDFRKMVKEHNPDMIFLCLPNNPLGECLEKSEVFEFISEVDKNTLVVVDGAYQEYASYKDNKTKIEPKELIQTFENTLYLGTFSKAYGLGGMRVGYGVSNENIIKVLHKLRPPFNITTLSLKAAIIALDDEDFVKKSIEENFQEMKRYEEFTKQNGFQFIDSYTNFITILMKNDIKSTFISENLLKNGIIVRDLNSYGVNAIRVTIGKKEQNDKFFQLLSKFI
jgi:histidinol-phosphate aminotransferase